ncbi:putative Cellobiose phosphorylase domain protein [Collimonas arenae]|nr:putative Cellobiose phosphorylase domain protein [Collimonas arenae]
MEVRYLANRDDNLRFCLLTDFADADTETMPDDAALLEHTKQHIDDLNKKYNRSSHNNFLLLHRRGAGIRKRKPGWVMSASAASWLT